MNITLLFQAIHAHDRTAFERELQALDLGSLSNGELFSMFEAIFDPLDHPLQGVLVRARNQELLSVSPSGAQVWLEEGQFQKGPLTQAFDAWLMERYPHHWARRYPGSPTPKPEVVFLATILTGDKATLDALGDQRQVAPEGMGNLLAKVAQQGSVDLLDTYACWLRARMPLRQSWWEDAQGQAVKHQDSQMLEAILRQPEAVGASAALVLALQNPERLALITPLLQAIPLTGEQLVSQFAQVYANRAGVKLAQALPYRQAMDALTAMLPYEARPAVFDRYPGLLATAEAQHRAETRQRQLLQATPAEHGRPRRPRA